MTISTRAFVRERVAQFRGQVERRIDGSLTEDEFKPLRLMNGLYLQLHAYMLRVAMPYGTLNPDQMRQLAMIAERWDKGYGHFTTRQNIQFNWPRLRDVPDMLDALADVGMHAIQTSGNTVRNVTADHFAGAAADEIADPRPIAELLRQWSTDHPEFQFLPRKFKIAITGSAQRPGGDRSRTTSACRIVERDGEPGFEVLVGGGLGRTPMIGQGRPRVPAAGRPAALRRGHPRDLQPARPPRQQVQGAPQDHRPRAWARRDPRAWSRSEFAARRAAFDRLGPGAAGRNRRQLRAARLPRGDGRVPTMPARSGLSRLGRHQPGPAPARPDHAIVTIIAEGARRNPGRRHGRPDARDGRSCRALRPWRAADQPRAERHPAACPPGRPAGGACGTEEARARHRECRPRLRHHRLPGHGLLRARHRPLDPHRAGDRDALRRAEARARGGTAQDQDLGLHQRLRAPPCRPYRHPRPRPGGGRELPDHARRRRQRGHRPRRADRAGLCRRRGRARGRAHRARLPRPARGTGARPSCRPTAASAWRRSRPRSTSRRPAMPLDAAPASRDGR